jgi:hypothetical protein
VLKATLLTPTLGQAWTLATSNAIESKILISNLLDWFWKNFLASIQICLKKFSAIVEEFLNAGLLEF